MVLFQWPLVPQSFLLRWAWLGVLSYFLSPSVAFFHQSICKTTFICCNSRKLLIGCDEFMIERFSSAIRRSRGRCGPDRAQLRIRWTSYFLTLKKCISTVDLSLPICFMNAFGRTKLSFVYSCIMFLCQFSRCPSRGMQQIFLQTGLALLCHLKSDLLPF